MKAFTVAWINIQMYGFKCAPPLFSHQENNQRGEVTYYIFILGGGIMDHRGTWWKQVSCQ